MKTQRKEDQAMLPMLRRKSWLPNVMDDFFGKDLMSDFFDDRTGVSVPAVNVIEDKDDFKLELAAPGLSKSDFKVNVENNILTISSEKESKREEKDEKIMRREFSYSSFSRSFTLPETVNAEKISASHKDGILTVVIPKRDEAKVKPVKEIKIS